MRLALAFLFALALVPAASAAGDEEDFDAVHHTADGNYLDFLPIGKVELPRLFVVRDASGSLGVRFFGSSTAAVASGEFEIESHGGAAHGEEEHVGDAGHEESPVEDVADESLVELGVIEDSAAPYDAHLVATGGSDVVVDLSPTRHLVFVFLAIGVLCLLFLPMAGKYKKGIGRDTAPRGLLQNMLETVIIYVRDEIARPNLGEKTSKYLPYLLTVFFFILICNLLGLVPFGATATANISITVVLAVFTFIVTQLAGTKDYWGHIFNPPGVPLALKPILIPIEFIGIFTKPFALAIRLFANLTAGHLVILNLIGIIFIISKTFGTGAGIGTGVAATFMVLFVYALEVLVAFIQAYVFTILSALFIGMASAEHEHDHDHAEDHGLTNHDVAVAKANGTAPHKLHERTVGTEATFA
ncbi:F0F1 ATP synthase subunit A [Rubricoccus marinus]|uniref:ATP synthase subunit a n=1 Tax=Rubricoccus marinus TaxID=716817 RepID=A0A259TVX2_9BACT|nr:F0F1 ATP synthase subunit A [Rubricoccus marinus]OZC01883.1 ATP synthase F0 subunit A [Rubricoccus marinus]